MGGLREGFEFRVWSLEFLIPARTPCPVIFPGSPEPFLFELETRNSELKPSKQ